MCGIVGIVAKNRVDRNLLEKAIRKIRHRGPDHTSVWVSKCGRYGLAHARLSIIDIGGGNQPLFDDKGNVVVVNGEFYDYKELRRNLQKDGYKFKTESDSEILLPLMQRQDVDKVYDYLRGEFAFVHVNMNENIVTVARDRFGIKPLYYYECDEFVIFASEAKSIFEYGVEPRWNERFIVNNFTSFISDPEECFFQDIKQVKPAHFMRIQYGKTSSCQYWDHNYNSTEESYRGLTDEQVIGRYRSLFYDSVKTRLVADVPVGVYLSGGLDSASVLGVASDILGKEVAAFTISFSDKSYDEYKQASEMASHAKAKLHTLHLTEQDIVNNFEDAVYNSEYIFTNTHGVAKYILSSLVRKVGYKTVLTGEGADEHLSGYPFFRYDDLVDRYPDQHAREEYINELMRRNNLFHGNLITDSTVDIPVVERIIGFVPAVLNIPASGADVNRSFLSEDMLSKYKKWAVLEGVLKKLNLSSIEDANRLHKSMYIWTKTIFPNYLLNVLGDRMEMAHSVEARVPFLDHKLVDFLCKVPSRLKVNGYTEKFIHREALRDVITNTIYQRQKHPFMAPPATLDENGPLMKFYREVIFDRSFDELGLFNADIVRKTIMSLSKMPISAQRQVDSSFTSIVCLALLARNYNVKRLTKNSDDAAYAVG